MKQLVMRDTSKYKYLSKDKEQNFNISECCICLDAFREGQEDCLKLRCKHIFHENCMDKFITGKIETEREQFLQHGWIEAH